MKQELLYITGLIVMGGGWIYACMWFTGINPAINRKPSFLEYMTEMNHIIDNATEYAQMLQIPSLISEFKKDHPNLQHLDYYVQVIQDARKDKIAEIAKEKNLFAIRAGKPPVKFSTV